MRSESAAEFRRRRAVELMLRGERKTVISRVLGVDVRSLTVWMRKVEAGQILKIKPGAGRPRRLSDVNLRNLGIC
jgi:transposase